MIPLRVADLVGLVDGSLHGATPEQAAALVVDGPVVTDSREAGPGGLYVARIGAAMDGHDFVPAAAAAGCVAALTTRAVEGAVCVVVDDEQEAFVRIARHVVDSVPGLTVVGITGSSGKTSTKDLLASVLATAGETVAPVGSLNSEVGVPLTVCRATPATRFLVVEMGARGVGHIEYLTRISPPRIGAVLNVGTAHVGEFGSKEAIARAKSELVAALPADGVAVLNADDPLVRAMAAVTAARVVLVGESPDAQVRATEVRLDRAGRPSYTVTTPSGTADVTLGLVGRHHVANSLAVVAISLECGLDLDATVAALGRATPLSRWRMEVTERADGVVVVNDAYNANPDSMRAALAAVAAMEVPTGGRRWAVLGSMLELGETSVDAHRGIGSAAADAGVDELLVVGEVAAPMVDGAAGRDGIRVRAVADADEAETILRDELAPGDLVVLKSSRDAGLRHLGDRVAGRIGVDA
jgi:UDP-N-acetylmuramoyl-tripeptide--D-alanyl-D-alanine ligase